MKHQREMTLDHARSMASALVELLKPACEHVAVAGGVRRGRARPQHVEIVALPRFLGTGESSWRNLFDERCDELLKSGVLVKRADSQGRYAWGQKLKRAVFYQGANRAPVDLFAVIPPAQWGVIYALRTGPGRFNRLLVTGQRRGGACPLDRKVAGGRVWFIDPGRADLARMTAPRFARQAEVGQIEASLVATPTEEDFFRQLSVPYWPPEDRTVARLIAYLRQKS